MNKQLKEKHPNKNERKQEKVHDKQENKAEIEKKKKLETKIRKQVACEEKAFRIVERLIENPISEEFLIDSCQFIAPHHYDDIVEERAITKTCGYPICSNPLTNISKQRYHISTRENKVYDITERKNFCSNQCYRASKHLQQQISTSPLWSREEERGKICLLSSVRGLPGLEVVGPVESVQKEIQHLKILDQLDLKKQSRSQENKEIRDEIKQMVKETSQDVGVEVHKKSCDVEPKVKERSIDDKAEMLNISTRMVGMNLGEDDNKTLSNKPHPRRIQNDSDDDEETESRLNLKTDNKQTECSLQSNLTTGNSVDELSRNSKQEDKMQHLMKLLDRRKQLLGQLAEIETVSDSATLKQTRDLTLPEQQNVNSFHVNETGIRHENVIQENKVVCIKHCECENSVKMSDSGIQVVGTSEMDKQSEIKEKGIPVKSESENVKLNAESVIQMICQSIRTWITPETVHFMKTKDDLDQTGFNQSRADFEAMYQALCRRVDAGEFEIEDIGESKLGDEDVDSLRPLPQYDVLKAETREFEIKVKNFYAGKLFVDPVEKEDNNKTPVSLPAVDSLDQMLIRRKIVMERLQKVITDLLSPLKLTIQDVYTEYKELIATFRLDSKNILYKPAEWTIINMILLRMLSRKNRKIKAAFLQPSSVKYFKILLGKLGTNLQQIDLYIDNILLDNQ